MQSIKKTVLVCIAVKGGYGNMEILRIDHTHLPPLSDSIACIGFFDGLHKGHQALILETLEQAEKKSLPSSLITFDPDPWTIFHPDRKIYHILPLEDKMKIAEAMGLDRMIILHFTEDFAALSVDDFHLLLHHLHIKHLICGFDFAYAYKNQGNVDTLHNQNFFSVKVIDKIQDKNGKISSTRIENSLLQGWVLHAAQMLGACYSLEGIVQHGYHRGSSLLSFPTANLRLNHEYLIPKEGVYSGLAEWKSILYPSMINIGKNPTFNNDALTIEAHLIDFNKDLYDQKIRLYFVDRIRDEMRFSGVSALKSQLQRDILTTKEQLNEHSDLILTTAKLWNKNVFME